MAKLTAKARNKLPSSKFAGPGRSYPIPDKSHAANAKARSEQQYEKGRISKAERDKIWGAANKLFKKHGIRTD